MSTESNKENVRRGFEVAINDRRLDLFSDHIAPDYVNHNMPTPQPGPDGLKAVLGAFIGAFDGFRVTLNHVLAEGDLVSTHGSFTGTHTGDFMGIPPTGKSVTVEYIDLWRFEDGLAKENWVQIDIPGLMAQLGVGPSNG